LDLVLKVPFREIDYIKITANLIFHFLESSIVSKGQSCGNVRNEHVAPYTPIGVLHVIVSKDINILGDQKLIATYKMGVCKITNFRRLRCQICTWYKC